MASLTPLDLAALLCSRVCHDVISPVGAIVNGLEVLEGEQDDEMRAVAMELIKKSAISASARPPILPARLRGCGFVRRVDRHGRR